MAELLPVEPFDVVVFGATGDLALRKLMPALYHRWLDEQIPAQSRIIATSRSDLDDAGYRAMMREAYAKFCPNDPLDADSWAAFSDHVVYRGVDAAAPGADLSDLASALDPDPSKIRMYYLALPPSLFGPVSANISANGLVTERARIVLEKPIGTDYGSAEVINDAVGAVFDEHNIFRIDHYLGKETVQNLLILRFTNSLFEPVWNSGGVDHVQITVAESIGAGGRASYYDTAGALRDMVQNHLLQLLCLVAIEPPSDLDADSVRDEKIKVLRALRPLTAETAARETVRAQYVGGASGGEIAPGYADELGRASETETFVSIKAHIDNWRWAGVPFYLRTGKRMAERRSEIVIQFKPVPHSVVGPEAGRLEPNRLVIRLQPDEGVKLMLMTKEPGPGGLRLRSAPLNLSYAETFKARYPDAYERLLLAVVRGNLGLFMRRDEVEAAWTWVDGILQAWKDGASQLHRYPAGSDGPTAAALLLDRDGREWVDGFDV
ncbi:MAG: glucose-6-phosphate dehydrogenase [Caulobacterales bacterium]|nr:glucose-6-phosphate dehydrogenase [Caulobacterales bacterium]